MPKLRIADDDALNAFATGLNEKQYSITVTRGLIERAQRPGDRSRARPRAHPYPQRRRAHDGDRGGDRRRDLVLRRDDLPAVLPGAFSAAGRAAAAAASARAAPALAIVIALALIAVAWLLSIVIRFALSRQREFLADAGSVELTKNPDAMISALRKIEGRGELHAANSAVMEMCIDNPREGFADIFATHPSVDTRVEALVKFAGGHDPGPLALAGAGRRRGVGAAAGRTVGGGEQRTRTMGSSPASAKRRPVGAEARLLSCPAKAGHPAFELRSRGAIAGSSAFADDDAELPRANAPRTKSACAPARPSCAACRRRRAPADR